MAYIGLSPHPTLLLPINSSGPWMQSQSYIRLADIMNLSDDPFISNLEPNIKPCFSHSKAEQDGWQREKSKKSLWGRRRYEFRGFKEGHRHFQWLFFSSLKRCSAQQRQKYSRELGMVLILPYTLQIVLQELSKSHSLFILVRQQV